MNEKENIFIRAWSFIKLRLEYIRESRQNCRELSENEAVSEYKENLNRIIITGVILLAIFGCVSFAGYWVINLGIILISPIVGFLIEPKHFALKILSIALFFMLIFAIIFGRKKVEKKEMGALDFENDYQLIRNRLYIAALDNSDFLGLVAPTDESKLTMPNNTRHEMLGDTPVYKFIWKKSINSDIKADIYKIKKSLMESFWQMQRNLQLPTRSPYGVLHGGIYYCSILIMSIVDDGDYYIIGVSFADENSIPLFKDSTPSYKEAVNTKDEDF